MPFLAFFTGLPALGLRLLKWFSGLNPQTELLIIAVCAGVGFHLVDLRHIHKLENHNLSLSRALGRERDAHTADIARWKAGSDAATKLNKATLSRVMTEQTTISQETTDAYTANLAALRASYGRMRNRTAPINQCAADGAGASPVRDPASGIDGDGMSVSPDATLQASEIELRLLYLQQWVTRQVAVDPNAKP